MDSFQAEGRLRIMNKQGIKIVLLEKDRITKLWTSKLEDGTPLSFSHTDLAWLEKRIREYYFGKVSFRYL